MVGSVHEAEALDAVQSWCAESFRLYSIVSGLHSRELMLFSLSYTQENGVLLACDRALTTALRPL